jgi:XisH protein
MYNQRRKKSVIRLEIPKRTLTGSRLSKPDVVKSATINRGSGLVPFGTQDSPGKEGWQITADPYKIRYGRVNYEVDLAAENVFAAERGLERIDIEIKSFIKESIANEFHAALGQFLNYKLILESIDPERHLYLAVRQEVFEDFFQYPFTQEAVKRYGVDILVFQPATQEVVLWKNSSDTES